MMFIRNLVKVLGAGISVLSLTTLWSDREYLIGIHKIKYGVSRERISVYNSTASYSKAVETKLQRIVQEQKLPSAPTQLTTRLSNNTAIHSCELQWNILNLNVTVYEADKVEAQTQKEPEQSYVPPLLYPDPEIKLNRTSYLIPDLIWGPNNQLVGFMESVFVAIKLNRSLVIPSFLKHNTDKQFKRGSRNKISPLHRVDLVALCKYVSCVAVDQFQRACNFQIDGILNTRFMKPKDFAVIERDTGMKLNRDRESGEVLLIPKNGTSPSRLRLTFTERDITSLFTHEAKCVVYPFPFFDVMTEDKGSQHVLYSRLSSNVFQTQAGVPPDVRLMASIFKHIPRPAYIRQIAADFIGFMTYGGRFMSSHWRYNEGDYLANWHCGNKEINQKRCDKARNYTSRVYAERLSSKAKALAKRNLEVNSVYIATPRTDLSFVRNTSRDLAEFTDSLKIYHSLHLEEFMKDRYKNCEFLTPHIEDIVSSVEMEICSRAVSFLGSLGTTWSGNVFKSRMQLKQQEHETSPDYIFRVK